ncbi:MAG: hypothetical protein PHS82_14055 [Lachnospiraceae bacterium]|nr:hypothetical protein [Lachnospiraceae bacterium]
MLFILLGVCTLGDALGGTWAARSYESLSVQTPVTTNTLSIQMPQLQMNLTDKPAESLVPGAVLTASTHVFNDGDYEEYVRVKIEKAWIDGNGISAAGADSDYITLHTDHASDWIIHDTSQGSEASYYYYTKPIAKEAVTSNIIDSVEIGNIPSSEQNLYNKLHVQLNLTAESVQRIAGREAIRYEWNVPCTMDENGQLLAVGDATTE